MSDSMKPSTVFWGVAGLFLLWNVFGCYLYILDMTMSDAAYTAAHGEAMTLVRSQYPAWSKGAYAIAVWGGLLAAMLLLLRKKLAVTLFLVSLIAAIISFTWALTNADARAAAGSLGFVMPLIVVLIGLFEIWWSRKQVASGLVG